MKSAKKLKIAVNRRILIVLALALTISALSIDFFLSKRWGEVLSNKPSQFQVTVDADMCNALSNKQYFGTRIFLNRMIKQNIKSFKLIQGSCNRGSKSLFEITKKIK